MHVAGICSLNWIQITVIVYVAIVTVMLIMNVLLIIMNKLINISTVICMHAALDINTMHLSHVQRW